jgi:transposase InsO family protein
MEAAGVAGRRGAGDPKKSTGLVHATKAMKYEFVEQYREDHTIVLMCKVLEVKPTGYYAWRRRPVSAREQADEGLIEEIKQVVKLTKKSYGSVRVTDELNKAEERKADPNKRVGHNRVARLMRKEGIKAKKKSPFRPQTTDSWHNLPVAPNRLNQDFAADGPGERLVSDITYIKTKEGWLYLCVVLDLYSRMVVGWSMMERMPQEIVLSALRMALGRGTIKTSAIFHSDRGSQYAARAVRALLAANQMLQSMSRSGNVWDNAVAEAFFSNFKTECIPQEGFATREEAKQAIFQWIEIFYNRRRSHSTLGYQTPMQFELAYWASMD